MTVWWNWGSGGLAAGAVGTGAALWQAELFPKSLIEQLPFVMAFMGFFLWMVKYHLQEQDKWRTTLQQFVSEQRSYQMELLKVMHAANKDAFESVAEAQIGAFEEALERISAQFYTLTQDQERAKAEQGSERRSPG